MRIASVKFNEPNGRDPFWTLAPSENATRRVDCPVSRPDHPTVRVVHP
jgi:protocatechuate 3,4-dioxygenase beta subunit